MVRPDQHVTPDTDVVLTELEGQEAVLLHLGTRMYFTLNETGLRIWQMLSDGLTPDAISKRLSEEFDVTPEKAKESVLRLVNELKEEKLVRIMEE